MIDIFYNPHYKCFKCQKEISGFIDNDKICINEQYLYENGNNLSGKDAEYNYLHSRYKELQKGKLSEDEIIDKLDKELCKIHLGERTSVKIKIRKEEK